MSVPAQPRTHSREPGAAACAQLRAQPKLHRTARLSLCASRSAARAALTPIRAALPGHSRELGLFSSLFPPHPLYFSNFSLLLLFITATLPLPSPPGAAVGPPPAVPAGLGDDHLRAQLMKLVPQLLGLQAAGDFGHLLAGDDGGGGDEGLGTQGRGAAAEVPVGLQAGQIAQRLRAGGLLNELLCGVRGKGDSEGTLSRAGCRQKRAFQKGGISRSVGPLLPALPQSRAAPPAGDLS